jgi:hypothetical protein
MPGHIFQALSFLALFGNWIDFNFKSSLDIAVYMLAAISEIRH